MTQIEHDPKERRPPRSGGRWGDYLAYALLAGLGFYLTRNHVLDPYFCSWLGWCS